MTLGLRVRDCSRCGRAIFEAWPRRPGRPRRWCSPDCRRAASEEQRAADNGAIGIRHVDRETSIEDHVRAVLGSPAASRRVLRELVDRAARGDLEESRWRRVLTELERLRQPAGWSRELYLRRR